MGGTKTRPRVEQWEVEKRTTVEQRAEDVGGCLWETPSDEFLGGYSAPQQADVCPKGYIHTLSKTNRVRRSC